MRALIPSLAAAAVIAVIGLLGMAAGMPWLFPSLGPTIAIQAGFPQWPSAQPRKVFGGHLSGLAAGYVAVYVTGAVHAHSVTGADKLTMVRIMAASLAILLSMLLQHAVKARHPPAEATTLLIALGAMEPTIRSAFILFIGILLVTLLGEGVRRTAGRYAQ
jgi:CBS-domain-containing membrane protein